MNLLLSVVGQYSDNTHTQGRRIFLAGTLLPSSLDFNLLMLNAEKVEYTRIVLALCGCGGGSGSIDGGHGSRKNFPMGRCYLSQKHTNFCEAM